MQSANSPSEDYQAFFLSHFCSALAYMPILHSALANMTYLHSVMDSVAICHPVHSFWISANKVGDLHPQPFSSLKTFWKQALT